MILYQTLPLFKAKVIKRPSASIKSPYVADILLVDDNNEPLDDVLYLAHSPSLGCCGLAEIKHNDEEKNLFKKGDSFFWIDFEAATFSNNYSNNEMNINNNNKNNKGSRSLFGNNNNNRPPGLFGNNKGSRSLFGPNNMNI